jgi:hypothetical protein
MVEYAMVVHKTMLLCPNKSVVVYLCKHLDFVTYKLYKMRQKYMMQGLKGNSGLDGRWPPTEQGVLKFLNVTIITICNLDECYSDLFYCRRVLPVPVAPRSKA